MYKLSYNSYIYIRDRAIEMLPTLSPLSGGGKHFLKLGGGGGRAFLKLGGGGGKQDLKSEIQKILAVRPLLLF